MMNSESIRHLPRATILVGLAVWISIAVLNNITDSETNIIHLETMLSMHFLIEDQLLGNGIEWRSLHTPPAKIMLLGVIFWQFLTAIFLWIATIKMVLTIFGKVNFSVSLSHANIGLTMFLGMWLLFLCGGLWFGYWIKQGAIQGVHMNLLIISIASLIYINQPGYSTCTNKTKEDTF